MSNCDFCMSYTKIYEYRKFNPSFDRFISFECLLEKFSASYTVYSKQSKLFFNVINETLAKRCGKQRSDCIELESKLTAAVFMTKLRQTLKHERSIDAKQNEVVFLSRKFSALPVNDILNHGPQFQNLKHARLS